MTEPDKQQSLSQLVQAAGLTGNISRDEAAKVPGQISDMITSSAKQLDAVEAQIISLQELADRIEAAKVQKMEERARIKRVLGGLHDAHNSMAKP